MQLTRARPGRWPICWIVSSPWRPHSRAALMASHGTLSSRSCLAAIGRITSRAKRRTVSWNSSCSSLSLKSTCGAPPRHELTDQSIVRYPAVAPRSSGRFGHGSAAAHYVRRAARVSSRSSGAGLRSRGCTLGDDEPRPPQLGVQAEDEAGGREARLPRRPPPATPIRVGGGDAAADAAGVASALFPATGELRPPDRGGARGPRRLVSRRSPPPCSPGRADRRADPARRRRRAAGRHARTCSTGSTRRARTSPRTPR